MRTGWSWQSVKMANRVYGFISRFIWRHGFEIVTIDFLDPVHDCWNRKKQQMVTFRLHFVDCCTRPRRNAVLANLSSISYVHSVILTCRSRYYCILNRMETYRNIGTSTINKWTKIFKQGRNGSSGIYKVIVILRHRIPTSEQFIVRQLHVTIDKILPLH